MTKIFANETQIINRRNASGFSLIEVLITLLILAIGVLGIAALQFKALKYGHDANIRTRISYLASDIADRMRINRVNIANYMGNYQVNIANLRKNACNNALGVGANVANDLGCWRNEVDAVLPHGSNADITVAGDLYTISLSWTDREGDSHIIEYSFQ